MARISLMMLAPPVLFAALAGLFFAGMMRDNVNELPSTRVGQAAPDVAPEPVPGTALLTGIDLRDGEITILNFWASWCPPCRAEHQTLLELSAQGYRVAGLNFRDEADKASEYLIESGNPFFATGFDLRGRTAINWGVTAPPETFIISGDGTVLFRFAGPLIGSDYEQRFLPALRLARGQ